MYHEQRCRKFNKQSDLAGKRTTAALESGPGTVVIAQSKVLIQNAIYQNKIIWNFASLIALSVRPCAPGCRRTSMPQERKQERHSDLNQEGCAQWMGAKINSVTKTITKTIKERYN